MVPALYYLATAMVLTTLQASVLHGTTNFQLEMYRQRNHVMLELLIKDGCKVLPSTRQRAVREIDHFDIQLRAEKVLYEDLTDQLISCKAAAQEKTAPTSEPTTKPASTPASTTTKPTTQTSTSTTIKPTTSNPSSTTTKLATPIPTTTPSTATTKPTTKPSTTTTTTSVYPQPPECQSASNLTEYWRKDHNGTGINLRNATCDNWRMYDEGRPWFRFSGDAGTKLLDHCINSTYLHTSCGTHRAIWSDAPMPTKIGTIISIPVYGSYVGDCKKWEQTCSVIRCSSKPSDFIYRYDGDRSNCANGFCGMD